MNNLFKIQNSKFKILHGQTMLLTVILISTAIMGSAALAGLLVIYNARNVSDIVSSTQAIFAANSGLECVFYKSVKNASSELCGESERVSLPSGSSFATASTCTCSTGDEDNPTVDCSDALCVDGSIRTSDVDSTGYSGTAARSLKSTYTY